VLLGRCRRLSIFKPGPSSAGKRWQRMDAGEAVVDLARTFGVDRATLYRL
jgi:hypothetical protein